MLHLERWKIIFIALLTVLGIAYAIPNVLSDAQQQWAAQNLPGWMPHKTVNLGLDLRGGSHLLLEADTKAVLGERLQSMLEAARTELRRENIAFIGLAVEGQGITFRLDNADKDRAAALKIARGLEEKTDVVENDGTVTVTLGDAAITAINTQVIGQSIEIVRRRIDESGTKEPVIQRQGTSRIVVQLPGVENPEEIKRLIGKTAKMGFHLLDMEANGSLPSPGSARLPMREKPDTKLSIRKRVMVSGDMLIDARAVFDRESPVVSFRFNAQGAKKFCDVTRDNVGKPFAIVLDNEIISAPTIQGAICGGSGQITGRFSLKEANDLALLLRAGALPAPLQVVEERSVGPTLGSDSITSGKKAAAYAFGAVVVLTISCYGLFGFFAVIALALNMAFIFAILSIMQATLTLPGIAGIVLTIGMAVDANVLIFERIREELRNGRSVIASVDSGYQHAMGSIIDANLTTMIVALILFSFGTGPVKGFAVSMTVGIITSLFSAIWVTRLIILVWLKQKRPSTLTV
jgi:preprotein translocase subunit SecD